MPRLKKKPQRAPVSAGKDEVPRWNPYWCETEDHDEDWFVVALSEEEAAKFHEDAEGYDSGDASAKLVCELPAAARGRIVGVGWPSEKLIVECGGEFISRTPDGFEELRRSMDSGGRIVRFGDQVFGEGDVVGNAARWVSGPSS